MMFVLQFPVEDLMAIFMAIRNRPKFRIFRTIDLTADLILTFLAIGSAAILTRADHWVNYCVNYCVNDARADEPEFTLAPIIKDASPLDLLAHDPILPVEQGTPRIDTSSGSVQHSLANQLPYSVTDEANPGTLSQFRGLGRSSDETDVQTLGIPLNYPQGGGFDFSTFPQFFWADFRFQPGPSPAGLDPRGIAGTMALVPWTAKALSDESISSRYTGLYSNSDLVQLSVGAKYKDQVAVLAGNSSGLASGPSASISGRLYEDGALTLRYHLLFTDIDAEIEENPPEAIVEHSRTMRTIPVVQADWKVTPELLLKSSFFYDNVYLRTDDPAGGDFSQERTDQFGAENALFYKDWKLGASSREVRYNSTASGESSFGMNENISSFQLSKLLKFESGSGAESGSDSDSGNAFLIEPTVQAMSVSDQGFYPEGTLGLREEWGRESDIAHSAVYARGNYARRFPSIVDRYLSVPNANLAFSTNANPNLQVEKDVTGIVGAETKQDQWDFSVQGYYQIRYNAEVGVDLPSGHTLINSDQARIASLVLTGGANLPHDIHLYDAANFTYSHVNALDTRFPFIPNFIDTLGLEGQVTKGLGADVEFRAQSNAFVGGALSLNSLAYVDIGASYQILPSVKVLGRIENLIGNDIVLDPFSPPKQRVFSVAVAGVM
jgi:hypothetical protein